MIFYNFFFLSLWMQLVKTNTKTWRPALCKPLCVEGLHQLTSGPQFVSGPAGTHRPLTCWTLGMYLSTEMKQGLNYFLIRFSAFIIPFLKILPRSPWPCDGAKLCEGTIQFQFSAGTILAQYGAVWSPGGTFRRRDPSPTWTYKHSHLQSYATSCRHSGVLGFRYYPHCAA